MLTFRNTSVLFILLIMTLIILDLSKDVPWYYYALLCFFYSLALFYGSSNVSSGFYMPVLTMANTRESKIAISFDDGPAANFTEAILDILLKKNVPAAFFCIGKNIAGHESVVNRIVEDGHIIGNHSYSHHFWFDMYSSGKMREDLGRMSEETMRVTGLKPNLFRPPYGVTNPNLAKAVSGQRLVSIGWNIRSMDTVIKDAGKLLKKVVAGVKPGSIVLFHDTSEATFLMLPAFIDEVRAKGYEIVRLDKLLNVDPYA